MNPFDTILNDIQDNYKKDYEKTLDMNKLKFKPGPLFFAYGVYLTAKQKQHADNFFNLREFIQKNPEQYIPALHQHLFTEEEVENLCQK